VLVGYARLNSRRVSAARTALSCGLAGLALLCGSRMLQNAIAEGDTRTISLHHVHTDENITITFKRDGRYDDAALEKLNWFLRDWRREQQTRMDPHLIDLIWEVQREAGSKEPVWVVCGYRSPETNAMLRHRSAGVARFSQHMLGHAMDFYIPGVPLEQLRVIGLRLQRGGVGFYPTSGSPFVHMDTGGVRHWPRMTREQLVRVFPDGRTVHIPTDGRPLPGYALALADIRKNGGTPSEMSVNAARGAGIQVADADTAAPSFNPFAKLLHLARNDEDDEAAPAAMPLHTRAKAAVAAAVERTEDKIAAEKVKLVAAAASAGDKIAAEKAKLIQVAANAAADAEDKIAAEKTKLVHAASKVHVISRAEAAPLAAMTPNEIILARGFWQGLPEGMRGTRPATTAGNALAAATRPQRTHVASTAETTGSVSPFTAEDRVPPELALAYAEQPDRNLAAPALPPAAAIGTAPRAAVSRAMAMPAGDGEMTIAVKRVNGRASSTVLTVTNRTAATAVDDRENDPWLRAVVLSPSVERFLCITALGARDFRTLAPLMVKPASAVMMTFAADPQDGLTQDHFSGSAIVFLATVTYPTHTAGLQ
jgi:uncharacterized protein YcbK (DUF882 family)